MKFFTTIAVVLATCGIARGQWQNTTYNLRGGWNAIHLSGDASYDEIGNLFPADVLEVWRWNPNPTQVQFTESPLIPSAGVPEWQVWKRGFPADSSLNQLTGQASYLVKCSGSSSDSYTVVLKQSPLPPKNTWVRNGANLMGFPTSSASGNFPLFSNYFASFPIATAANTKIFKYVGGELGPANPLQVFSPSAERLDRSKAYWFSAEAVGNFYGPLEINLDSPDGIRFGRTGSLVTAHVRNRSGAPITVTFTPTAGEAAPVGEPEITGLVPITLRSFNTSTLMWQETPISDAVSEVIAPQTTKTITFGIDRGDSAMSSSSVGSYFASLLRVTDSGNLIDIALPVSATKGSLSGLWVGDIALNQAGFGSGGGETSREFGLRTLIHVPDSGSPKLLSEVYLGPHKDSPHASCVTTDESQLDVSSLGNSQRLTAAHMPLNQVITTGSGSFAIGASLERTIQVPFNDPTNPFVHQYHPDHDNKSPRGQALPAGVESYDITRTCTFEFTSQPPSGSTVTSGWGSSVVGGVYRETITGLHRNPITLSGTFELRRVSEIGVLTQ